MPAALRQYLPSLGLVLAAVLSFLSVALTDNRVSLDEALALGIVLTNALATYIVPRLEGALWLKPATAVVLAVLQAVVSYLTGGVTYAEWVLIALAGLGALGVVATNSQVPVTPKAVAGGPAAV